MQDDAALIRAAQNGERAAFGELVGRYYNTLYRFAYRWCGNREEAEDITQQACIKLARSLGQFRFEAAFSSWLYRLVINCAKDWRSSQHRHRGEALTPNTEEPVAMPQVGDAEIYLQQVLRQLEHMGEHYKETALLVFAEGMSHAEAASVLEVKESTVSWRLHEIRKQLQLLQRTQPGSWEVEP
ncbi:MAG TPA: RNA polymerase sigma factor [Cellvibrionaceae bacterium]|nr:RNA polymerase sigma factor [Cellvibrionaceae bacterium]HMW48470.1 RNA polymerase sigma factor [Cellvibrionaceae bacterium]HMW70530.1 RNA polymerase sigma factor [Cellvibrionaceae bacterium]HMY37957.1 RNA polymerase sigma factor [Marinagarivorans sp.]HNG60878.1 RNA polymerase sigma factor [Cellvibrionaceae bacterium]